MDNIINELKKIKVLLDILERQFTLSGGIGDNITYTPQQFKELLNKVDALMEENDRLKKDVAYWHNESDVHFEDFCKKGEQLRGVIDKACEAFCKRCVHNQTIKKCMYLGKDCPLLGAFKKDLED